MSTIPDAMGYRHAVPSKPYPCPSCGRPLQMGRSEVFDADPKTVLLFCGAPLDMGEPNRSAWLKEKSDRKFHWMCQSTAANTGGTGRTEAEAMRAIEEAVGKESEEKELS